jgi:SAM-dependent methyltransferase
MAPLGPVAAAHLAATARHYDDAPLTSPWAAQCYRACLAHYYNWIIPSDASVLEIGCGSGELLAELRARQVTGIDLSEHQVQAARRRVPHGRFHCQAGEVLQLDATYDFVIISDTLNYAADVQMLLARTKSVARSDTRLLINFTSALWRPFYRLATAMGLRANHPRSSWLSVQDVHTLLTLAGWRVVKSEPRVLIPIRIWGVDRFINRWIAPLTAWFCICVFTVARVDRRRHTYAGAQPDQGLGQNPSVSVVIPARNESGNIAAAAARIPQMGSRTELIFVEGHSTDDTWEQIQRVRLKHPNRDILTLRQAGNGKGDAVRAGLAAATGEIVMILDADLTVPPEDLPKFYDALVRGQSEFCNGVRLVYPMENEAMRFLNLCANRIFGQAFSWLLGQPVKDTLCGTKSMWKKDYDKIAAQRAYFGEFDPFGDFDLLFGADKINLHIVDIPVRYGERTYGITNIHRWRHGWLLFRMVGYAARKLKFV